MAAAYEVLASDCGCDPEPHCPKVARRLPGLVAIVGPAVTDPEALAALGIGPGEGAVEITEALYRTAYENL